MRTIILNIFICAGFYLVGAFGTWDFNPSHWPELLRFALAAMSFLAAAVVSSANQR